jgi:hypothetical protein
MSPIIPKLRIMDRATDTMLELSFSEIKRATIMSVTHVQIERQDETTCIYDFGLDGQRRLRTWLLAHGAQAREGNDLTWYGQSLGVSEDQIRRDLKLPPLDAGISRLEHMTRAAARAIGRDLTGYEWDNDAKGLRLGSFAAQWFSPLTIYGDAFEVEARLQLNVLYQYTGSSLGVWASSAKYPNMGYMTSVPTDPLEAIKARMLVVTQFAALLDLVEGGGDA